MIKRSFEFDTRFSDIEQRLEERKNNIKPIRFKTCSKCGETKPDFRFPKDKRNLEGRTNICKACRSLEALKYYYHNQSKILIQGKEYRDNHKKNRSIYNEKYREDHKEELKERASKWYQENKKAIKKRNLKYYQENLVACQIRRGLWITKNKEKIREYNKQYKRKQRKGDITLFEKVDTKEIKDIKRRLESELEDKNLPFQRKEEVRSLLCHIDTWLDWREDQEI